MTESLARTFADFASTTSESEVPERAFEQASIAIIDVVGVAVAGARTELGRAFIDHAYRFPSSGPSTIIGGTTGSTPEVAARTNGTLAHILDYDDRGHASTHLFASALAVADLRRTSGLELLHAYILGREVRARLDRIIDGGRMEGAGPGSRGWHSTGVNGPIASALTAGILLGLDRDQLAMAMAMAASTSSGLLRNFGTGTKPTHAGHAATEGVRAAMLVGAGIDSDPAAIDGPSGLFEALAIDRDVARRDAAAGLGVRWDLVDRGVRIKPYPSCTTSHPALETAAAITRIHGPIPPQDIVGIKMDTRPFMLMRGDPRSPIQARFSMAHAVLVGLERGSVSSDAYGQDVLDHLHRLRAYAKVEHVAGSSEIVISLTDGRTIRQPIEPLRNLTESAEIDAKFLANLGDAAIPDPARLLAELKRLRSVADVREIGWSLRIDMGSARPAAHATDQG